MKLKKLLNLILVVSLVFSCLGSMSLITLAADEGSGSEFDPYIIRSANDFTKYMGVATYKGKFFKLGNDIELPSNYDPKNFLGGYFDGNNKTITINIDSTSLLQVGVFKDLRADNGTTNEIKNLIIKGSIKSTSASSYVGSLSARTYATSATYNIKNIKSYVTVEGQTHVGGIIGAVFGVASGKTTVKFEDCVNYGNITATNDAAGGILGMQSASHNSYVEIINCRNEGEIKSTLHAGGLLGFTKSPSGKTSELKIESSANLGNVSITSTSQSSAAGGIIGEFANVNSGSSVSVAKTYNAGAVNGYSRTISGIIGKTGMKATVENCFNAGSIEGDFGDKINGAILGYAAPADSTITNCYNAGDIVPFGTATISTPVCSIDTVGNYYLEDSDILDSNEKGAVKLTEDELKASMPQDFDLNIWEYVSVYDAFDYYMYPQIKGNTYFYEYKLLKDCEQIGYTYGDFAVPATVKGVVTGADVNNVKAGISIYSSEKTGANISSYGTFPDLYNSEIIYDDSTPGFSISKSAIIYVATKDAPKSDDGFTPVLSLENKDVRLSLVSGNQYYISQKTFIVSGAEEQLDISGVEAIFVKWIETAKITTLDISNGKVYVNNVEVTAGEYSYPKGGTVEIKVIPDEGYYLKNLSMDSDKIIENQIEEASATFELDKDYSLSSAFELYDINAKLKEIRTENPDSSISQIFKLEGNGTSMISGKKITLSFIKDATAVDTDYTIANADGSYEITMDSAYQSGEYTVKISLEITPQYVLDFYIKDDGKDTYYISSVVNMSNLIITLNTDKDAIVKEDLINQILTDKDINFEITAFKDMPEAVMGKIIDAFLDNTNYNISNIYQRFDDAVIFSGLKNSQITASNVKAVLETYDSVIDLKSEPVYDALFTDMENKDGVYNMIKGVSYSDYQDIVNQFNFAVVLEKMADVAQYTEIMPYLLTYKTELNIDSEADTYSNFALLKQNKVAEYIYKNKGKLKLYDDLKKIFREANASAGSFNAPSVNQGGSAPSGGGSSNVSVSPSYIEEAKTPVETITTITISDLSDVDWAREAIIELLDLNVINGYSDGTFKPQNNITRAEFIKLVVTAFSFEVGEEKASYDDVKETDWYYDYVIHASKNGLVRGKSDNLFMPNDLITRQEMAVILHRVIFKYNKIDKVDNVTFDFNDNDKIADYALNSVAMLAKMGVINGFPDGTFGPSINTTRAEAAQLIYKILNLVKE